MQEPPRTALGISTPNLDGAMLAVTASHFLTYGRGACGVCPGLSGLKAIGPI